MALLIAVSASVWIGNKLSKRSGSDVQKVLIASAVSGVIIFIVVLSAASFIGNK